MARNFVLRHRWTLLALGATVLLAIPSLGGALFQDDVVHRRAARQRSVTAPPRMISIDNMPVTMLEEERARVVATLRGRGRAGGVRA